MIDHKDTDFFIDQFNSLSKKQGVSFDFCASERANTQIFIEKQKLNNCSSSTAKNLALRLSMGRKSGVSYTKNFSKESLKECYNQALNGLNLSDKEERGDLSIDQKYQDMSSVICNFQMPAMDLLEKIEKVKTMDLASSSLGDKIKPIYNASKDQESSYVFGNSEQTKGSYCSHSVMAYSYSLAVDKNHRSQGLSQQSARDYADINFQKLGQESASKSLKKLNFSIPKTNRYPVVFQSGQAACTLVSLLVKHLNGKNIHEQLSLLKASLNTKKLSSFFSLYDDPFVSWGLLSSPFDDEGFSSQKTNLVEKGVIKNYLTNSFIAKTLEVPHTAKAYRSENGVVDIAPTNIIMGEGMSSFQDLLQDKDQVIVIDFLKGLAGYNPISGNFSIESEGFLWNGDSEAQAICEFTVSGNLIDVFANISKVARDSLYYCNNGSFKAPSFLTSNLSIAGA